MGRIVVAVDLGVGFSPDEFASAWNRDRLTADTGSAVLERPARGSFLRGVAEFVLLPLTTDVDDRALYKLVRHAIVQARRPEEFARVTMSGFFTREGDRFVVVRPQSRRAAMTP